MNIITIIRDFGSGGRELGCRITNLFGRLLRQGDYCSHRKKARAGCLKCKYLKITLADVSYNMRRSFMQKKIIESIAKSGKPFGVSHDDQYHRAEY